MGPAIPNGLPSTIHGTCVGRFGNDRMLVANNDVDQIRRHLLAGSRGALLVQTSEGRAYPAKAGIHPSIRATPRPPRPLHPATKDDCER